MYVVPDQNLNPIFPGDDHESMKVHQFATHRMYLRHLFLIVCREFFLSGSERREVLARLWNVVEGCRDDRPLMAAYEHLAAYYRMIRKDWLGVMPAWEETEAYQREMSRHSTDWMDWWWNAVKLICGDIPLRQAFADCFIEHDALRDSAREAHLLSLLQDRFPLHHHEPGDGEDRGRVAET